MGSHTRAIPTSLLPKAPGLRLSHAELHEGTLTVHLQASAAVASCPQCHHAMSRIHSRYTRTAVDLPWAGAAVRLVLQARKFFWLQCGVCPTHFR